MVNKPMSLEITSESPQSPVLESPEQASSLMKSLPFREVGDQTTPEGPGSQRLDDSPPIPSKFYRIDREPESPNEVSQQATRTSPMSDPSVSPREFPGLQVDPALSLTIQERLRRTNAVILINISTRGYYQPNANGDQPLTEATLVETLIVMHQHIQAIENVLDETNAAWSVTEERLRNAELLVRFLQSETAAKRTQGVKRPREETDP
jgi:hypothetical protein